MVAVTASAAPAARYRSVRRGRGTGRRTSTPSRGVSSPVGNVMAALLQWSNPARVSRRIELSTWPVWATPARRPSSSAV